MRSYRKTLHRNRVDGVAQDAGPEFKPQDWGKKKEWREWIPLSHF
jgi:hypothetical protein